MVQGQFRTGKDAAAKLAGVPVAQKDILPGKRPALLRNVTISEQPNHGRNSVRMRRGVYLSAVQLLRLSHAFQHKHHGTADSGYVNWLVCRIQDQYRLLHEGGTAHREWTERSTTSRGFGTWHNGAPRFGGMAPPGIARHVPV